MLKSVEDESHETTAKGHIVVLFFLFRTKSLVLYVSGARSILLSDLFKHV